MTEKKKEQKEKAPKKPIESEVQTRDENPQPKPPPIK